MKITLVLSCVLSCVVPASAASFVLSDAGFEKSVASVLGGTRLPVPVESARVPGSGFTLTAADLEASGGKTLVDALRLLPGVVIYDQTGSARQPTLDLRGFNATPVPATVVLLDGVRVNEADFGQVNWQLIPLSEVERVEVLPGPQTAYGPGAMGGVVSVVTKRGGAKTRALVGEDLGSFGLHRYLGALEGPAGPLTYRAEASRETEDGWRHNSGARLTRASGRLDYRDDKTEAGLSYRFADDDLKQAGSLTADELRVDRTRNVSFVETDALLHQGALSLRRSLTDETAVSFLGDLRRRLENTPLNRGRSSTSKARSDMNGSSGTVQLDDRRAVLDRANAFAVGAELSRDLVNSSSSGDFSGSPFANAARDAQRRLGVFAQESIDLIPKTLVLTAGGRWDRTGLEHEDPLNRTNDGSRIFHHFSPRAGLNWNPAESVEAFASVADSFRAPTVSEITALGPFSSSPDLKPVSARSVELGVRGKFGARGSASASVYRTVVHDEIFPVYDPVAGYGQNRNLDKTRRDGLELSLNPKFGDLVDAFVNYGYTEATFQTDFTLDKVPFPATQRVRRGSFLPQVPRHRVAFGASLHPVAGATVGLDELCVSSQFVFGDEANAGPRLGGSCVLGGGASYERGSVRVFVRGDNLLDRRYESRGIMGTNPVTSGAERYLMPAPGISFSAGIRWRVLD